MTHEDTMELNLIKNKKKKREFYAMTIACEIMAVLDPYIDDSADFDAALDAVYAVTLREAIIP